MAKAEGPRGRQGEITEADRADADRVRNVRTQAERDDDARDRMIQRPTGRRNSE